MKENLDIIKNNELMKNKLVEFSFLFTILNKYLLLKNNSLKTKLDFLKILNNFINLILMVNPNSVNKIDFNIENDNLNILSKHLSLITKKYGSQIITNKTKNRALVSFSNRKLWKQKGTGRARAGSKTSPLFRGGGVVFGPTGYCKKIKINKKLKKKLFFVSIIFKLKKFLLLELFDKSDIKQISQKKVLMLTDNVVNKQKNLYFKYSNYKNIILKSVNSANLFDILRAQYILINEENLFKLLKRMVLS